MEGNKNDFGHRIFLTQRVQIAAKHVKGWEWFVLDNERINQDIIQILINVSAQFCEALVGFIGECTRQPVGGLFDLSIISKSGDEIFVEIKCDQDWSEKQRLRQFQYLSTEKPNARCALLLFSQRSSTISSAEVKAVGDQFFKLSYNEMYKAIEALLQSEQPPELVEFVKGYKVALEAQYERTKFRGDPNR